MKKRIAYFLLVGCMAVSIVSPMQAAEGKDFLNSLRSILSRYFSELSSLSQVSFSNQLAALRTKEVVLASDCKKRNTVYKKLVQSVRSLRVQSRKECARGMAYLKTDSGKKTIYETALFTLLMAGGYKLWLQNQQTQQQVAAMQGALKQLVSDGTSRDAASLQRDQQMWAGLAALNVRVKATQKDLTQSTGAAKRAFQTLAKEIRNIYDYDSDVESSGDEPGDSTVDPGYDDGDPGAVASNCSIM